MRHATMLLFTGLTLLLTSVTACGGDDGGASGGAGSGGSAGAAGGSGATGGSAGAAGASTGGTAGTATGGSAGANAGGTGAAGGAGGVGGAGGTTSSCIVSFCPAPTDVGAQACCAPSGACAFDWGNGCDVPPTANPCDATVPAPGTGSFTPSFRVVTGPAPVQPVEGARVAYEAAGGTLIELVTGADGVVPATALDAAEGPWSITAAKPGHSIVSVMNLDATLGGDLRIDPPAWPSTLGQGTVNGTIVGATPWSRVLVDAFDFNTVDPAGLTFGTTYEVVDTDVPLQLFAMELDGGGRAVNFAQSAVLPRTLGGAVTANLVFPSPPVIPNAGSVTVHLPAAGATFTGLSRPILRTPTREHAFAWVGTSVVSTISDGFRLDWTAQADPTVLFGSFDLPGRRVNVVTHLGATADLEVTVPDACVYDNGSGITGYQVAASGDGYDVIIVHLGETANEWPRWRVFVPFVAGKAAADRIPRLPGGLRLDQLVGFTSSITHLAMAVKMHSGDAWSSPVMNAPIDEYAYATTGAYRNLAF